MKTPIKPIVLVSAISPLLLSLVACGSGGSGAPSDKIPTEVSDATNNGGEPEDPRNDSSETTPEEQGVNVTSDAFRLAERSGVWRLTSDFHHLDHQQESVDMDTTIARDVESQIKINSVLAWNYVDDTHIAIKDCFQFGSEVLTLDQFNRLSIPVSDNGNDIDETVCDAPLDLDYYIISDSHFRIDARCHGNDVGTVSFTKLSTQSGFHQGSLNFVADAGENLSATSDVCGSRFQIDSLVTYPSSPGMPSAKEDFEIVEVRAPYRDTSVLLNFSFPKKKLDAGEYTVNNAHGPNDRGVTVSVLSTEFPIRPGVPAPPGQEIVHYAESGTVSITSVSERHATATFDLTIFNMGKLEGDFTFDLR